jgi:CSLREA domain-containing protein
MDRTRKLRHRSWIATTAVMALGLVSPGVAGALTVNSTGDDPDANTGNPACLTAGGLCTFRAAVQQANATPGADTIGFTAGVTDKNITIASSLDVTEAVSIDGCSSQSSPTRPCVGVRTATGTINALNDLAEGVTVKGLAIAHSGQGIFYGAGATGLNVRNSWFGLRVGGTAEPNGTGITLTGSGAVVGGTTPGARNVFANGGTSIQIFAGSDNQIRGNFFGTLADGTTAAPNAQNITVLGNGGGSVPVDNVIGTSVSSTAAATPACDGGCNVIAAATSGSGIDLAGGSTGDPAGPTLIRGNFIGLDKTGAHDLGNAPDGINIGCATGVTVGGPSINVRNVIGGNVTGLGGGGCGRTGVGGLTIQGNLLGLSSTGGSAVPDFADAADVTSSAALPTVFTGNHVGGDGTQPRNGIELSGAGGEVTGNAFGVGTDGQDLPFQQSAVFLAGSGHVIGGSAAADANVIGGGEEEAGLVLNGADNVSVRGNFIGVDAKGNPYPNAVGVLLANSARQNTIGGDTSESENVIARSGDSGVIVADAASRGDVFGRNRGANGALFFDLGNDGAGNGASGPNGGAQAPTVATATTITATGTAPVGARVRLFLGETGDPGKIKKFVGSAVANGSGAWSITYGTPLTAGQRVAATQTGSAGTSELSALRAVS